MVLVQLEDPVEVRSMYQPIGISGKISIKSPNADAYDSVYIMHVEKVEDVLKEGDLVKVKVLDIDSRGKVKLSMKEANPS